MKKTTESDIIVINPSQPGDGINIVINPSQTGDGTHNEPNILSPEIEKTVARIGKVLHKCPHENCLCKQGGEQRKKCDNKLREEVDELKKQLNDLVQSKMKVDESLTKSQENFKKLKLKTLKINEDKAKLEESKEGLEETNDLLERALNKEREENKSKILALTIALNDAQEALKVSQTARIKLEEEKTTLYKIYETKFQQNSITTGANRTVAPEPQSVRFGDSTQSKTVSKSRETNLNTVEAAAVTDLITVADKDEQDKEIEEQNNFLDDLEVLSLNRKQGFNRKDGPSAPAKTNSHQSLVDPVTGRVKSTGQSLRDQRVNSTQTNSGRNRVNENIMTRDSQNQQTISNGISSNIAPHYNQNTNQASQQVAPNTTNVRQNWKYCHFFNNHKECPNGLSCWFRHELNAICRSDGFCQQWKCTYQHPMEYKSFLGVGPMRGRAGQQPGQYGLPTSQNPMMDFYQTGKQQNQSINKPNQTMNFTNQVINSSNQAMNHPNQAMNNVNQATNHFNQAMINANQTLTYPTYANQPMNRSNQSPMINPNQTPMNQSILSPLNYTNQDMKNPNLSTNPNQCFTSPFQTMNTNTNRYNQNYSQTMNNQNQLMYQTVNNPNQTMYNSNQKMINSYPNQTHQYQSHLPTFSQAVQGMGAFEVRQRQGNW